MTTHRLEELLSQISDAARSLRFGQLEVADAQAVYYVTSRMIAELETACRERADETAHVLSDSLSLLRYTLAGLAGLHDTGGNSPDEIYDLVTGELLNLQWDVELLDWEPSSDMPQSINSGAE